MVGLMPRNPSGSIAAYLEILHGEAKERGYRFNAAKIAVTRSPEKITAIGGQLLYEWVHRHKKLQVRAPGRLAEIKRTRQPEAHPLFDIVDGDVESWENLDPQ